MSEVATFSPLSCSACNADFECWNVTSVASSVTLHGFNASVCIGIGNGGYLPH